MMTAAAMMSAQSQSQSHTPPGGFPHSMMGSEGHHGRAFDGLPGGHHAGGNNILTTVQMDKAKVSATVGECYYLCC